jgi:hypothetical protein
VQLSRSVTTVISKQPHKLLKAIKFADAQCGVRPGLEKAATMSRLYAVGKTTLMSDQRTKCAAFPSKLHRWIIVRRRRTISISPQIVVIVRTSRKMMEPLEATRLP